jgi:hypothetical protein
MKKFVAGKVSFSILLTLSVLLGAFFLGKTVTNVLADPPDPKKVDICHWDEGSNAYKKEQEISYDSIYKWDNGKKVCETKGHGLEIKDIIPTFANGICSFAGLNTDKVSWIANGCVNPATPVNCVGSWSDTRECSVSCGGGTLEQVYHITTPASNGGTVCSFSEGSTQWGSTVCNTQNCPVNGVCGTKLNDCSVGNFEDENDTPTKYKWECNGLYGGRHADCELAKTPINCAYHYTECSATCGEGTQSLVIDTEPANGGTACPRDEIISCGDLPACEVDQCTNIDKFQDSIPDGYYQNDNLECYQKTAVCTVQTALNYQAVTNKTYADNSICSYLTCGADEHVDLSGTKCLKWELGGASSGGTSGGAVLGASTSVYGGQVLGASTMAGTGTFSEGLYLAIMGLGGITSTIGAIGIKKASKKA